MMDKKTVKILGDVWVFLAELKDLPNFRVLGDTTDYPRDIEVSPINVFTNIVGDQKFFGVGLNTLNLFFEEGGFVAVTDSAWNVLSSNFNSVVEGNPNYKEQLKFVKAQASKNGSLQNIN